MPSFNPVSGDHREIWGLPQNRLRSLLLRAHRLRSRPAAILLSTAALVLCSALAMRAQEGRRRLDTPGTVPHDPPRPRLGVRGLTEPDEPAYPEPAATNYHDAKYKLTFHVPAGWNFERHDGVLSNFGVDTRATRRNLDVRGVAALNYNPYPVSTFASANFYYSVLPHANPQTCADQASSGHVTPLGEAQVDGISFRHGRDQHGHVCTESRDEVFTTLRGKSCLRFDLVVNTFCSETSGAMEISPNQLRDVDSRLAAILGSVHFEQN